MDAISRICDLEECFLEIMPSSPPQKRSTTSTPGSLVAAGRGTDAACFVIHGQLSELPSFKRHSGQVLNVYSL